MERTEAILKSVEASRRLNKSLRYLAVHGITPEGECTCGAKNHDPKDIGKHPVFSSWQTNSTGDLSVIEGWLKTNPYWNLGLDCKGSGVVVIDIDPRSGGHNSLEKLEEESRFSLIETVASDTGKYQVGSQVMRGTHLFYRCNDDELLLGNLNAQNMPGIDIKHKGYVVLAGSSHASGVQYSWKPGASPEDLEIAHAPEELLVVLRKKTKRTAHSVVKVTTGGMNPTWSQLTEFAKSAERFNLPNALKKGLREGERAVEIYRIACSLANRFGTDELARELICDYLISWNVSSVKPPMEVEGPNSLLMHANRAIDYVAANPLEFSYLSAVSGTSGSLQDPSDASVVEWLSGNFEENLCWSKGRGWSSYLDGVWRGCADETVRERIRVFLREYWLNFQADPESTYIAGMLKPLLSASKIKNYENLLRGALEIEDEKFNARPDLLNVQNGVVDLETGSLLSHDPKHLFTQICNAKYRSSANHPDWEMAVQAIPHSVREWVQVYLGQACTGHTVREDIMVLFTGGGRNGKSTIVNAVNAVLGSFAVQVSDRILSAKDGDHTTDLTDLAGKRFASLEEHPGTKLNVKRLKEVVGTARITARRMRQDNQTWDATHTFLVTTNFDPQVESGDDGTWRRLVKVHFPYRYVSEPKLANDRPVIFGLRERVQEGVEGQHDAALAWLVQGALKWYQNGKKLLEVPEEVLEATSQWRASQDLIGAFLSENLELAQGFFVAQEDLARLFRSLNPGESEYSGSTGFSMHLRSSEFFQANGLKCERKRHAAVNLSRPSLTTGELPVQTNLIGGVRFKNV